MIIYDQCAPKEMPACNTLFIGSLPARDNLSAEKQPGSSPADTTVVENKDSGGRGKEESHASSKKAAATR